MYEGMKCYLVEIDINDQKKSDPGATGVTFFGQIFKKITGANS